MEFKKNSQNAVVILHEIYGINKHIRSVCEQYFEKGFDVYCPDVTAQHEVFTYGEHSAAFSTFAQVGFSEAYRHAKECGQSIRQEYKKLFVVGFSVGATLAWLLSETGLYEGAVSYYGSRIRDYLDRWPQCPALLIFAEEEESFYPQDLLPTLNNKPFVRAEVLEGRHGFMDRFNRHYNAASAKKAERMTEDFFNGIQAEEQKG